MNSKNAASSYLKSEAQTMWWRNAQNGGGAGGKRKRSPSQEAASVNAPQPENSKRGSDVLIIHPGSRYLRLGRASDHSAVTVPNVIARKFKGKPAPPSSPASVVPPFHSTPSRVQTVPALTEMSDEYQVDADLDDPTDTAVGNIRANLRARMYHFDKLPIIRDGSAQAAAYNQKVKPTLIPAHQDPNYVEPLKPAEELDTLIGDEVFQIGDAERSNYAVRWPMRLGRYNCADYTSRNEALADMETLLTRILRSELKFDMRTAKDVSVILIVPDYPDTQYIRDMTHMFLAELGFRRISVQQESVCSSYGASIATGCIVDIGASKTSVSCVEEGLIIPDTRLLLNYGGDDISELYLRLLERISLPYKDANLARAYDWSMMDDLKLRTASLAEEDVVLMDYELFVRRPGQATQKYILRTYDEPTVSSMVLFDPTVLDFESKRSSANAWTLSAVDEMDPYGEATTAAMHQATIHLAMEYEASIAQNQPNPQQATDPDVVMADLSSIPPLPFKIDPLDVVVPNPAPSDSTAVPAPIAPPLPPSALAPRPPPFDTRFEAGKVPLDLAIYHSIQASVSSAGAAGQERLKKMLSCILVVGGTALTPGMLGALDSRLRGLVHANIQGNEDHVAIIPAPKSIDPRILAWKGASVLAKLESVNEQWVQKGDWDMMGMRAFRDRSFFL